MRDDQIQRLEELISQPDMVPCMPLLRSDVEALLAAYKRNMLAAAFGESPEPVRPEPKLNFFD